MTAFFRLVLCTWFILCIFIKENVCVKNVTIIVEKAQVDFQSDVTLYCYFELEKDELMLSVIWLRGTHEFYRFRPSYRNPQSTFMDYNIMVDLQKSNKTHVTIRQVGYELSGNITCEVTPETTVSENRHIFKQKTGTINLQVISPPRERPTITTDKTKYKINDTLEANCTSALSYPPSSLSFLLNNEPVGEPKNEEIRCNETKSGYPIVPCRTNNNRTTWTWLPLKLKLEKKHFKYDRINLTCTAILKNTDNRSSTEITLPSSSNEPKSQRVQSSAATMVQSNFIQHQIIIMAMTITWFSSQ